MLPYEKIYELLYLFANYEVQGFNVCRFIAPIALVFLLWVSRLASSVRIKFFAVAMAMILYFFRDVVNMFS